MFSFPATFEADAFRPVNVAQMRALDRRAIEDFGLPGAVLMENAGRAVAESACGFPGKDVVLFCGGGNNGGDGFVAARYLNNSGRRAKIVLAHPPEHFSGEALIHWRTVRKMKIPYIVFQSTQKLLKFIHRPRVIVDALLGTGARAPLREPYRALIEIIGGFRCPVVAVDVPSGLNADTGRVEGSAVKARLTVTMGLPKRGLLRRSAAAWVGRLRVADIGFPRNLTSPFLKNRRAKRSQSGVPFC